MIRFIDLGEQIIEGYPMFAWFDTVNDEFSEYSGSQTWDTWEQFEEDYRDDPDIHYLREELKKEDISRHKSLFPKKWRGG